MNDRLADLKRGAKTDVKEYISIEVSDDLDKPGTDHQAQFMQEFFADVDVIKKQIIVIRQATKSIGDINQQVITSSSGNHEFKLFLLFCL